MVDCSGIVTPAAYISGLLSDLSTASVTGGVEELALILDDLTSTLGDQNQASLAGRVAEVSKALRTGGLHRAAFLQSPLAQHLESLSEALARGDALEDAFSGKRSERDELEQLLQNRPPRLDRSVTARHVRLSIGPPPLIHWRDFGSIEFPPANPPSADIQTAGERLSYFVFYVAGIAQHGESNIQTAAFYKISEALLRKIRGGLFAPKALGQFPSEIASKLISKASSIEPKYGQLMQELIFQAFFESQGWSLGLPQKEAPWNISFMYALRRHVARKLLTEEGREEILEDRALISVVKGEASLEEVRWHPGLTRREVFEKWLTAINNGGDSARLEKQRRYIGDGILRATGWKALSARAPEALKLQWEFRQWIAYHHYGALPARGLPFSTQILIRFALARNPTGLQPQFVEAIRRMIH